MPESIKPKLTYSVPETAELLGIGRNTLYTAIKNGEVDVLRIGRRMLVSRHQLESLLGSPTVSVVSIPDPPPPVQSKGVGEEAVETTYVITIRRLRNGETVRVSDAR